MIGPVFARTAILRATARTILAILVAAVVLWLPIALVRSAFLIRLRWSLRLALDGRRKAWLRLIGGRRPLGGRGEAIGQAAHIVIVVHIVGFALARRARGSVLLLQLGRLRRGDQAIIMFRVLEVVLRRDRVAAGVGVARQLQVFFGDMMGVAADFDVRPVRLVGPRQRIGPAPIVVGAAAHALILTRSHLLSLTFKALNF